MSKIFYKLSREPGCGKIPMCKVTPGSLEDYQENIKGHRKLTNDQRQLAEEARTLALELLNDALQKAEHVLLPEEPSLSYIPPVGMYKTERRCVMERYAILTIPFVKDLRDKIENIKFVFDNKPADRGTFAYVHAEDPNCIVNLCNYFFKKAKAEIGEDSRPGILIHEASHFLGADDVQYKKEILILLMDSDKTNIMVWGPNEEAVMNANNLSGAPILDKESTCKRFEADKYAPRDTYRNANNVEYEFEIRMQHIEEFVENEGYKCCNEKKKNSVCSRSCRLHGWFATYKPFGAPQIGYSFLPISDSK